MNSYCIVALSVSYMCRWNTNFQCCFVCMVHMSHLYFPLFDSLFPVLRGETWNKKHFWFYFLLGLFAPQNVYLILLSLFIRLSLKDEPCQFLEQRSSHEGSSTWRGKKKKNFWEILQLRDWTVQAPSQVKSFPSYFVANESSKEPWRTEEHCLFVFERAFQRCRGVGKVVKLWESRLTERRDGGGEL